MYIKFLEIFEKWENQLNKFIPIQEKNPRVLLKNYSKIREVWNHLLLNIFNSSKITD